MHFFGTRCRIKYYYVGLHKESANAVFYLFLFFTVVFVKIVVCIGMSYSLSV